MQGHSDPNNPDVDNMSYEQLMEMGEKAGSVNRGLTKGQLLRLPTKRWRAGLSKCDECAICMDNKVSVHIFN